jgi:hypothetical protein
MSETTTVTTTPDAASTKDASVLNGASHVTKSPARPARKPSTALAALKAPARKVPAAKDGTVRKVPREQAS